VGIRNPFCETHIGLSRWFLRRLLVVWNVSRDVLAPYLVAGDRSRLRGEHWAAAFTRRDRVTALLQLTKAVSSEYSALSFQTGRQFAQ
jgi:hypothetical protein